MKKALPIILALLSGCATMTFKPNYTQHFINEGNFRITVDYGEDSKPHVSTTTLPNGNKWEFSSTKKVRVELPDGSRFVAYQRSSTIGNLYVTDDEEFEFLQRGPGCIIAKKSRKGDGYVRWYEGTLCYTNLGDTRKDKKNARRGSSPSGFKSGTSIGGESTSSGPRKTNN